MASQGPRGDGLARAFEFAVAALGNKERTLAEMRSLLRSRGVAAEDAEAAVARLLELGELDDERFARRFAEDKRDLRGWGPERIAAALAQRGVPGEAIERALADWPAEGQVERAAALLAERGQPLEDDRDRARALAFLARRGYESEVAYAAIRLAERGEAG